MSDIENRLVALDPAAHTSYEHPDLDALISRVTSIKLETSTSNNTWRNFKLKMGGAVAASALITIGAVTAFASGPALTSLALAKPIQPSTSYVGSADLGLSASFVTASPMERYEQLHFTAWKTVDTTAPQNDAIAQSVDAYSVSVPNSPSTETSRLAKIFGIVGTPTYSSAQSQWSITDGNASINYAAADLPEWHFSSGQSQQNFASVAAANAALPSDATVINDVQSYMQKLGYNYSLTESQIGVSTMTSTDASGSFIASSTKDISYFVSLNGLWTGLSISFSFNEDNQLVSASGPAFTLSDSVNYPLQGVTDAISEMNVAQQQEYATSTASGSSASPAPIAKVQLTGVSIALNGFETADGAYWFLPVYKFAGDALYPSKQWTQGSWDEIAVDPSYISGKASAMTGSQIPQSKHS